jgi:hypothetical protein
MPAIEHAAELKEVGAGLVLAPTQYACCVGWASWTSCSTPPSHWRSHAGRGGWDGLSYPSAGPERDVKLVSEGSVT